MIPTALLIVALAAPAPLDIPTPQPTKPDEPMTKAFSAEKAGEYLDGVGVGWTRDRKCITCHTNMPYLLARPLLPGDAGWKEVRDFLEKDVESWSNGGKPRGDAYVVATAFALAFVRMPAARAARWCAIACIMVLAIRVVNVVVLPDFSRNYYWSHTRLDSILFGCCLALWNNPALDRDAWRPRGWHVAAAIAVLLACLAIRDAVFRETLRYSLQGAALFVLFSAALHAKGAVARLLSSTPLRIVALLSYTLYLAHMPMAVSLEHAFGIHHAPTRELLGAALSFGYAAAMYVAVERPIARWRRRRDRARRTGATALPAVATPSAPPA